MVKRGIFIVLLLIVMMGTVQAQNDGATPTPDGSRITENYVDIFLPAAIRFRARFAIRPRDFDSAVLTLFQSSGFERTIPVNLESNVIGQEFDFLLVEINQMLDSAPAPRLFEPLNYRWTLTTADDKTYTVANEINFAPPLPNPEDTWHELGNSPLTFYWYNPNLGVDVLRENLLRVHDLLTAQTQLEKSFKMVIFESDYQFCDTKVNETGEEISVARGSENHPCSLEAMTAYYSQNGLQLLQRPDATFDTLEGLLFRQLVSAFYEDYWAVEVPLWFQEGLTLLYRPYTGLQELAIAQQAESRSTLLNFAELDSPLPEDEIWRAQSYLLLLYLADTYGATVPFEIALAVNEAGSFESAFEQVTGTNLLEIERAWRVWLQSQASERAAVWNPYLQTTPTVTSTATVTPIPPSRTPTDTATATLTLTPTSVSGREEPTVFVAPTNTNTPIATASNTPLPPGSLPTALPTATPPAQENEDDSGGLPCGAAAIAIPAIIITARQRKRS